MHRTAIFAALIAFAPVSAVAGSAKDSAETYAEGAIALCSAGMQGNDGSAYIDAAIDRTTDAVSLGEMTAREAALLLIEVAAACN